MLCLFQTLQDALNDQEENKGQVLSELLGSHPLLFDILTKTEEERRERDISLQSLLTQKYSADSRYPVLKRQSLCRLSVSHVLFTFVDILKVVYNFIISLYLTLF